MKKYLFLIMVVGYVIAGILMWKYEKLDTECKRYKQNTFALMNEIEKCKINDTLYATSVQSLELQLSEYKELRKKDAELIKLAKQKNRDLEQVTTMQKETITRLKGNVRDSIVYLDKYHTDTLRCIDIINYWYELHGCSNKVGEFDGTFINRDSIMIIETVKYKRFLGFLWKTKRIKDRKLDVISKNPYTQIQGIEHIIIK